MLEKIVREQLQTLKLGEEKLVHIRENWKSEMSVHAKHELDEI